MVPRIPHWLLPPLLAAWTAACSLVTPHFEKPILTVAGIELVGGNLLQQNFLVKFNVLNPNDRALPVTGLHAELRVLGERAASGVSNRGFVVPAHGTSEFDMTISANLALVLLKLKQNSDRGSDDIDYELTGAASIDLPFMRDLPFHQSGSFSLRGAPSLR
jgi:LEA14-like dessication related protein